MRYRAYCAQSYPDQPAAVGAETVVDLRAAADG